MSTVTQSLRAMPAWVRHVRFALALALVWAGLHFVAGASAFPAGLERPIVLTAGPAGPIGALLAIVVLWVGAAVATLILGERGLRRPMMVVGLALALWAAEGGRQGGTIDDWLIYRNEVPGPPSSAPYWALLPDYLILLIAVAGAYAIVAGLTARRDGMTPGAGVRRAFGLAETASERGQGLLAILSSTFVAAAAVMLLMGPSLGATYRGQVYFAIIVGFFAGVFVARRLVKVRDPIWFWPAPLLLGVIGTVVAGIAPGLMLPRGCEIDTIPAWALARGLPVEVVGAGIVGALWMLQSPTAEHTSDSEG